MKASVHFVDNDIKFFDLLPLNNPWKYDKESECFELETTEGRAFVPCGIVKCIIFGE